MDSIEPSREVIRYVRNGKDEYTSEILDGRQAGVLPRMRTRFRRYQNPNRNSNRNQNPNINLEFF